MPLSPKSHEKSNGASPSVTAPSKLTESPASASTSEAGEMIAAIGRVFTTTSFTVTLTVALSVPAGLSRSVTVNVTMNTPSLSKGISPGLISLAWTTPLSPKSHEKANGAFPLVTEP